MLELGACMRRLRHEVVAKVLEIGLIPTFYEEDVEVAKKIVSACADGGAKVIEYTNRGTQAYQVFSELVKWRNRECPDTILGAGTIIESNTASLYINCGAEFIVGPTFNPEVATVCNKYKIPYIPGCSTPTEISLAEEAGAEIVKVFPAEVLGPNFIKDILGPMPWSKLMPSGGVEATREDIMRWIKAGAAAINMGTNLIRKDLVKEGKYDEIGKRVEECIKWIREAKGTPTFLGVEHTAIYPTEKVDAEKIVEWYTKTFDFKKEEARASILVSGKYGEKIEVMREYEKDSRAHIGIGVSDFEKALQQLKEKGIEVEEPIVGPKYKVAYLKQRDPAGNKVHIIYRR